MPTATDNHQLRVVRVFPCSRERLWREWSDWRSVITWWGPVDWPAIDMQADFRIGGEWRACLRSQSGESLHQSGRFLEIVPLQRLAFTFKWDDDNHEDGPGVETKIVVTFSDAPGGACMDFIQSGLKSTASATGHEHGWSSTFDRLRLKLSEEKT